MVNSAEKRASLVNPNGQMIRLSKETKNRNKRVQDFEEFYHRAKEIFEPYKNRGERERYFEGLYNLTVCPGSRHGGRESRVVEFFWGNRMFDKSEGINKQGGLSLRFETEAGATMFFFKNDDGYVSIQLSPAFTDHRRPIEDFIFWKMRVDPSKLLKKSFHNRSWRAFMAYMEVTSLDGHPSLMQRIHVWWLRNFRHYVVEKQGMSPKYQKTLKNIASWVATVGFSGLVIFLLQLWIAPNPAEHDNVKAIQEAVQEAQRTIDDVKIEVEAIRGNQDCLIINQKRLNQIEDKTKEIK